MGTQEGLLTSCMLCEDDLVALNKIALKDHAEAWTTKSMMKSAVVPLQAQHEPVLESVDGSLAALCYQGARNTSFWVAHKALSSLKDNVLKDWAANFNLRLSVEALERELKSVKVILEFSLGKALHNLALEEIMMVLRDLVYDAEDVLDEMEYFRIQGDVLGTGQHAEGCAHNLDLNVLRFNWDNTYRRIEHIVKQIQLIRQEVSNTITLLGSDWSTVPNIAQNRPITISESIEAKLYGREIMMKSIIHDITKGKHSTKVLTVIPIVGPGGIRKTTLAQHIYHSGELQEHFDVRVWTCVSLNFNVKNLTEEIERYIPKVDGESERSTASELIGQRLKNKRLLLVLDDIWDCSDEDEWKRLLLPFRKSQVLGNIIIVTTRFPVQAQIMVQKNDQSIYLQGIENNEFEELFLEIIFGDDDQSRKDHTFLLETGFKIAGRLKGSPLAAKTVGRLLKTQLDSNHWKRILESKEWEHSDGKNDIMPALKLSFDYLPSQLQQCFSYCALFPQDYKFEKEELINFWIGQEVLHSSHGANKRVEDIGLSHLTKLVNYGFLENKGEKDGRTCYIIHDLLHELARKVSSLEFLSINSSQPQVNSLQILPSIRHLSISIDDTSVNDRLTQKRCVKDLNTLLTRLKVEKLQTLMIFGKHQSCFVKDLGDLFREAKGLRVIFLSKASYDVEYLLSNFYSLLHLRYLQIESASLDDRANPYDEARFPNKISGFYHMMILDAKHCGIIYDVLLPRDISNLVKLRHLFVEDQRIHYSIVAVGKLESLQELRRFVVKQEAQGFELRQIGHLIDLCGSLSIYDIQNIKVKEEADEAKLMLKSRLHELILCWKNNDQSTSDSTLEDHVLERLKPSSNLRKLSITGHRGGTCPSWLGINLSLSNLESLCLDDVAWKTFPPIGDLRLVNVPREEMSINIPEKRFGNLRRLELVGMSGLNTWTVHTPCQLFPYLEELIFKDCCQLVELSFSHSIGCCQQGKEVLFPRLKKLKISNCPQLSSFPPIPWTEAPCSINIYRTSSLAQLDCEKTNNSEYLLTIDGKNYTNDCTFWNVLAFHKITGLKQLSMHRCQSLPMRYIQMLSSLRTLVMSCQSNAFSFVEADSHVKYKFPVESLEILKWNASGKELTQLLTHLPKLSSLRLCRCEKQVTGLGVNVRWQQAMETYGPASSPNEVEQKQPRRWRWRPRNTRAKDNVIITSEEAERGMLLLPPQLQQLQIETCPELSLLRSNPHDDSNKEDGRTGGGGRALQGLTSLRRLEISFCPKLLSAYSSSSFSSSFLFPNSLEHLSIYGEDNMLVSISNLTSLTSLSLWGLLGDLRGDLLPLLTQDHLIKLYVTRMPHSFVESEQSQVHKQEIPSYSSKLQELDIGDVAGFIAASIHCGLHFSSLTKLGIHRDKVEAFTEDQEALLFVNSLEEITFDSCGNLQALPKRLHRLPNLKKLCIMWCRSIQMLPKDGLPRSLEVLEITGCSEFWSLPKDCLPDSLQRLYIWQCPAIRSLPKVDDLPSSLRELDIRDSTSEELRSQCRKLINIIPIVRLDGLI